MHDSPYYHGHIICEGILEASNISLREVDAHNSAIVLGSQEQVV